MPELRLYPDTHHLSGVPAEARNPGLTYGAEQRKLLFQALGRLSEQEQLLYHLCFVFEQDARKVAAVFKINVKNVYRRRETLVLKLTRLVQTFQSR